MAKVTGFLEFDRTENKSVNPKVRVKNFDEFILPYPGKVLKQQSSRCQSGLFRFPPRNQNSREHFMQ